MTYVSRRNAFVLAAPLLLFATATRAQGPPPFTDDKTLPSGARGERVTKLLDAVASGDPGRVATFVAEAYAAAALGRKPASEHASDLLALHDQSRGFDFHAIRRYGGPSPIGDATAVVVRNRLTGAWHVLAVSFDSVPDAKIAGVEAFPARPPADLPPQTPLSLEQAVAQLSAYVDTLAAAEAFSGTVLFAKDGKVLYAAAKGLADRNHAVPNRLETRFNLGSMNKMFTAVAAARLVEQGLLTFQTPVASHLSGWTKADLSKVRLEHLLTHTSGLDSYFNENYQRSSRQLWRAVADYKPLVSDETLAFEPGSKWQYSNTGFLLAGAVIEQAAGKDYFDLVRELVYVPSGMKDSDCYELDLAVPNIAVGYSRERDAKGGVRWRNNLYEHVIRGGPAGGGYSTASDLLAFAEALKQGRLVRPETLDQLWSAKQALSSPAYGYGFGLGTGPGGRSVGHTGGFPGISSGLEIYRDSGFVSVVLSNVDGGSQPVAQKIAELIGRVLKAKP